MIKKHLVLTVFLLFSKCSAMEKVHPEKLTIKEKWLAGLYTISKYPFEKKNFVCAPEGKPYLGFDATEQYIVVGTTLITNDIFWDGDNKHLKFYHPETNKLVDPNSKIFFQDYIYYRTYDPSNNFSIVGSADLGYTIFQEKIKQVFDLTTGKEIDDITKIRTHYILNRRDGNYHINNFLGNTETEFCDNEFSKDYDSKSGDFKSFRGTGYAFDLSQSQIQISNRAEKLENAMVLMFMYDTTETRWVSFDLVGLLDADPCNPRILCKHIIMTPYNFISKEGDAFGCYDSRAKELVIFKVYDDCHMPGILLPGQCNKAHDIFWSFN